MNVRVGGLIPNLIRLCKKKRKNKNAPKVEKPPIEEQRDTHFEGYRLTVSCCDRDHEDIVADPTSSVISGVLNDMCKDMIEFAILENSKSVGGCSFIQIAWGGNGVFIVEAQVRRRKDEGVLRSQYRMMTEDKSQVAQLLDEYLQGKAPNISDWEYMDDFDFYEDEE